MDPQGSTWIHTPHHARTRTRTPQPSQPPHSPLSPHTQPSMALTRALVRLHTRVVSGAIYAFNVAALVACLAAAVAEDALRCRLDRRQKGRFYVSSPDLGPDSEPARFVGRIEEVTGATGLVWWVRGLDPLDALDLPRYVICSNPGTRHPWHWDGFTGGMPG